MDVLYSFLFFNLCVPVYSTDVYTEGKENLKLGVGGQGMSENKRRPLRNHHSNPLGVYLLRDAKLYRRIGVHFEMQYNCFRSLLFYSVWPSKYLLFQSSEFFDGILKTFQFVFICFVGGCGGRVGLVGVYSHSFRELDN